MKLAATFLVLTAVISGLWCDSAEARYFRPVYNYDVDAVGRQERANMAEHTHQQKELMEYKRQIREKDRISAASTLKTYHPKKKQNKRGRTGNAALAQRQRQNNNLFAPQSQL